MTCKRWIYKSSKAFAKTSNFAKFRWLIALAVLSLAAFSNAQTIVNQVCANAGHTDVFVSATEGQRLLANSNGLFPVVAATGVVVVPATVRDAAGGPHRTDDPGWVVPPGEMLGANDLPSSAVGEFLWFRARGSLRYWDASLDLWLDQPPAGERVRYFAGSTSGLDLTPAQEAAFETGTIWTGAGLQGQLEAPIEEAKGLVGAAEIHAHLDFCLEDATGDCTVDTADLSGNPSLGGYLIEFELFSTAVTVGTVGNEQKYLDSLPIQVLLSNGLTPEDCDAAVSALVDPDTVVDDSPALPAAGILIMTGP